MAKKNKNQESVEETVTIEAAEITAVDALEATVEVELSDASIATLEAEIADAPIEIPAPSHLITDEAEVERAVEALIFASPKAISLKRIKSILTSFSFDVTLIEAALERIETKQATGGYQLVKVAQSYQFRTNPSQAEILQKLLEDRPVRLSPSALEVLAIIAYKQPVTRAEIDVVRGIDSGHLTRGLLEKNLIRSTGHADTPGRPLLYATTSYFLEVFSLGSLDDMPKIDEFDKELASKLGESEGDGEEPSVLAADPGFEALGQAALFHDHASPLAAVPDRGGWDDPKTDDAEAPDFGVADRIREENASA
jgi:segregation and condensation protein B